MWRIRLAIVMLASSQVFDRRKVRCAICRDAGLLDDPQATALIGQLRRDALEMRLPNRYTLPRWADRWWGARGRARTREQVVTS